MPILAKGEFFCLSRMNFTCFLGRSLLQGIMMRLADFIISNMEVILAEWEKFAGTQLPAARSMTPLALRDHAEHILRAVAKDLTTTQTPEAQAEKSKGLAPKLDAQETAAQTHAVLRAQSGFNINQLIAEYRALRASVLRLYLDGNQSGRPSQEDLVRFNEAIDQALAESVTFFSTQVERARDLFLGMIGHDLRNPLQSIRMTAEYLAQLNAGEEVSVAAGRLIKGGAHMQALLEDLVDYNRSELGLGIRIAPTDTFLATVFEDEVEQLRAAYPDSLLELKVVGDTQGKWDKDRLLQLIENLMVNAIKYGTTDMPVRVSVTGEKDHVSFEVRNTGSAIEQSTLDRLFEPLNRREKESTRESPHEGLGLGLFIAREIVLAHEGEIEARREMSETVFSVRLPRSKGEKGVDDKSLESNTRIPER